MLLCPCDHHARVERIDTKKPSPRLGFLMYKSIHYLNDSIHKRFSDISWHSGQPREDHAKWYTVDAWKHLGQKINFPAAPDLERDETFFMFRYRLRNRAWIQDNPHKILETNLERPVENVFWHSREFLAQNILYPGDLNKIQKSCSWFILYNFVIAFDDLFPKGIKCILLTWRQVERGNPAKTLIQKFMLNRVECDRELVFEFHTFIISDITTQSTNLVTVWGLDSGRIFYRYPATCIPGSS